MIDTVLSKYLDRFFRRPVDNSICDMCRRADIDNYMGPLEFIWEYMGKEVWLEDFFGEEEIDFLSGFGMWEPREIKFSGKGFNRVV